MSEAGNVRKGKVRLAAPAVPSCLIPGESEKVKKEKKNAS